ncbi:MAG: histidine-type phosphatase, partial [Bacteroidales bacterium]|nr:histidine-type phosphatase [Bacteroidales bacterium]
MKKAALFFIFVLWSLGVCGAQTLQEVIGQDPHKAAGAYYVYDNSSLPELTPAPEGYKPFYISNFARHGARYCTSEFDTLRGIFAKAEKENVLTEEGKDFFTKYKAFYKKVKNCDGNLTGVGKAQHRSIAGHLFQRFPEVFEGPTHVEAVSTESARV